MDFPGKIISWVQSHFLNKKISKYILYKIIDINDLNIFTLQCYYSKTVFQADISEITGNKALLFGLHPLQSCFIGIEYARHMKDNNTKKNISPSSSYLEYSYGEYFIKQQDRKGYVYFIKISTNEHFVMKPTDIAFSDKIISKFHAEHAFYIGLLAGLELYKKQGKVLTLKNSAQHNTPDRK